MDIWNEFKKTVGISPVNIDQLNRVALKTPTAKPNKSIKSNLEIEITPEYLDILKWLKAKAPIVFVTGKAGTGKTTLIHYLR